MRLLFINALKGLRRKKVQMLCIIFMVMLSTGIYSAMNMALDCLEDRYYNYLDTQNVEYLSVHPNIDYKKDISEELINELLSKEITEDEQKILYIYKQALKMDLNSKDNPLNTVAFPYQLSNIFNKYNALEKLEKEKLDSVKEKYKYDYELDLSKNVKQKKTYLKVIPYNSDDSINKAYLVKGKLPKNENEITMLPKYAKIHNIKIGDKYKLGDKEYKVVGFTYAPDYIFPLVAFSIPVFDAKTNNIVYINSSNYDEVSGTEERTYSIVFNDKNVKREFEIEVSVGDENAEQKNGETTEQKYDENSMLKLLNSKDITMSPFTIARLGRIAALQLEFATNRLFAKYFLYLLLVISVIVITIITKKRIDDERLQIGVLKSLGYNKFSIAVSYLTYPIVGSIIGGILGYLVGCLSYKSLAKMYLSYYIVPLDNFSVDIIYLVKSIFIPLVFLSILCYLVAIFMLRKNALALLREGSNLKVNIFSKIANKLTSKLAFKQRFKYSLALRSIPKLLVVAITAFSTGMLIVLTLIGVDLMDNVIDKSFSGMKFDYMIYTLNVENEKLDDKSDYVLASNINLDKVLKKNGKVKDMKKEEVVISVTGIDTDAKYIDVLNKKGKDIKKKLEEKNTIIINSNMQELYDLEVGDTIISKIDEQNTIEYKIIDIAEEYMDMTGYVNRSYYSKDLGFDKPMYTMVHSNNKYFEDTQKLSSDVSEKIATVINFEDLKGNIKDQMDKFNASIYVVIAFAAIMAFVIILVIANIIVEENKKTISLMKVLGYKNKEISSIVLNIYTPVIIISYLLSIPAMIKFLEMVIKALSSDTEMTIPIVLSYPKAILGLLGLLIAYYVALAICKKTLNKIPLAIALKRE